jgi:small subunit ribosomal protein S3Ae
MKDLTGDFTKQHIKLRFQIKDVRGKKAYTIFKGQSLSRDYMRSQIRRKSTRVEGVTDVVTKDGCKLRVKTIALALGRAQTAQEKAIRRIMGDMVKKAAKKKELDQLIQEIVQGKISVQMYRAASKIYPLKRVEVRKVKVIESSPGIPQEG